MEGVGALLVCRDRTVHKLKDDRLRVGACQQGDDLQHRVLHDVGGVSTQLLINSIHDLGHLEKQLHESTGVSCPTATPNRGVSWTCEVRPSQHDQDGGRHSQEAI